MTVMRFAGYERRDVLKCELVSGSGGDAGYGMNFVPLAVESVLDIGPEDANVRTNGQ